MVKEYKISWLKVIGIVALMIVIIGVLCFVYPKNVSRADDTSASFVNNINLMKQAGFEYFQGNNLPYEVGETSKLTLEEMIAHNLIVDFVDENGKTCSKTDSYIQATKTVDNEYALKVFLSCDSKTDYIVTTISDSVVCTDCDAPVEDDNTTAFIADSNPVYNNYYNNDYGYNRDYGSPAKSYSTITNYNISYVNNCSVCSNSNCLSHCLSTIYYTVNFNPNGGSYVRRQVVESGHTATYKSTYRDGYRFLGWYLNGEKYDFNTPVTKTITLYAKWEKIDDDYVPDKHRVDFDSNGGSKVPSQSIPDGNPATRPSNPTKACYDFAGWYVDPELTIRYNFGMPVTEDMTLYAKWVDNGTCRGDHNVDFDSNGGSRVPSQTVPDGDPASKPANPTRPCYDFVGWYVDRALTQKYNFGMPVTKDMTLYAKWVDNGTCMQDYTVTYVSNGGSRVPSETVLEGDTATKPVNPTKNGYSFVNWYTNSSLTTVYNFNTPVTRDITLYAKWSKNEELYNTYCKVEQEKYNSWSYTEHKNNMKSYSYSWTIKFDELTNAKNVKIYNISYVSDYNTFYKEYMNNKRITMVNQNDDYVGYVNSASILQAHALKSGNFTKSLSSPYYKGNYWYTNATVNVLNYNGVTKYYLNAAKNYVYFVPFTFDVQYTNLNKCVDDKASNSYKYNSYEVVKSYYE